MNDTLIGAIPQRVHLIGVGGIHMSGIAQILRHRGHSVSGSDLQLSPLTERLQALGVTVQPGHDASYVDDAELVVYTSAAHDDNPELIEAKKRGIQAIKRAEMVARLMEGKQVIAVAGSHGKTTTSSLIAFMLSRAGRSPTYHAGRREHRSRRQRGARRRRTLRRRGGRVRPSVSELPAPHRRRHQY